MMRSRHLADSFKFALHGMHYSLRTQRNMRIHVAAAFLVLLLAIFLSCTGTEIALLVAAAGFVICAEMLNTAIETAVDLCTSEYHPLAKIAKNVAAGAVFIASLTALIIGLIVFLPKLLCLLG